jgi:hypothetical protein
MIDYAKWITAAEPATGLPEGTLLQAYRDNLARGTGIVLDQSTHIAPLLEFMESQLFDVATQTHTWQGTTRELLIKLKTTNAAREARARDDYSMAQTPIKLGLALTRLTKAAKAVGLHIRRPRLAASRCVRSASCCARPASACTGYSAKKGQSGTLPFRTIGAVPGCWHCTAWPVGVCASAG